jgi:hypothetical protein
MSFSFTLKSFGKVAFVRLLQRRLFKTDTSFTGNEIRWSCQGSGDARIHQRRRTPHDGLAHQESGTFSRTQVT